LKFALRICRSLARWRPAYTSRVLAICALFGLLILSGVYAAREHTGLFQSFSALGRGSLPGINAARPTGYDELGPNDPTVRFAATGVGQLLIASTRSDHCRRLLFDNRTGAYYAAGDVFCGHKADEAVAAESPTRIDVVRKSFQR
jgi:hypothetical protein